jgi:hypothetical protein
VLQKDFNSPVFDGLSGTRSQHHLARERCVCHPVLDYLKLKVGSVGARKSGGHVAIMREQRADAGWELGAGNEAHLRHWVEMPEWCERLTGSRKNHA